MIRCKLFIFIEQLNEYVVIKQTLLPTVIDYYELYLFEREEEERVSDWHAYKYIILFDSLERKKWKVYSSSICLII